MVQIVTSESRIVSRELLILNESTPVLQRNRDAETTDPSGTDGRANHADARVIRRSLD